MKNAAVLTLLAPIFACSPSRLTTRSADSTPISTGAGASAAGADADNFPTGWYVQSDVTATDPIVQEALDGYTDLAIRLSSNNYVALPVYLPAAKGPVVLQKGHVAEYDRFDVRLVSDAGGPRWASDPSSPKKVVVRKLANGDVELTTITKTPLVYTSRQIFSPIRDQGALRELDKIWVTVNDGVNCKMLKACCASLPTEESRSDAKCRPEAFTGLAAACWSGRIHFSNRNLAPSLLAGVCRAP